MNSIKKSLQSDPLSIETACTSTASKNRHLMLPSAKAYRSKSILLEHILWYSIFTCLLPQAISRLSGVLLHRRGWTACGGVGNSWQQDKLRSCSSKDRWRSGEPGLGPKRVDKDHFEKFIVASRREGDFREQTTNNWARSSH